MEGLARDVKVRMLCKGLHLTKGSARKVMVRMHVMKGLASNLRVSTWCKGQHVIQRSVCGVRVST